MSYFSLSSQLRPPYFKDLILKRLASCYALHRILFLKLEIDSFGSSGSIILITYWFRHDLIPIGSQAFYTSPFFILRYLAASKRSKNLQSRFSYSSRNLSTFSCLFRSTRSFHYFSCISYSKRSFLAFSNFFFISRSLFSFSCLIFIHTLIYSYFCA